MMSASWNESLVLFGTVRLMAPASVFRDVVCGRSHFIWIHHGSLRMFAESGDIYSLCQVVNDTVAYGWR